MDSKLMAFQIAMIIKGEEEYRTPHKWTIKTLSDLLDKLNEETK